MAFAEVYNLNPRPYWMQFLYTGQMYSGMVTYDISITARIETITPSTGLVHIVQRNVQLFSNGPLSVKLYESPTVVDGTTSLTITNLDRRSNKTPKFLLYSNPTSFSGGTLVSNDLVTVNGLPSSTGNLVSGIDEIVLKPSTKYILYLQNLGTLTCKAIVTYLWYETGN